MGLLIVFFLLSIIFSFLCSVWEAVLLSITPTYIRRATAEGKKLGERISAYKKDIDKPLSAILTLNTIAHTVGAIGVGAQAGHLFGENYFNVGGVLSISYESVIAGVMTLAILILSEIIPKTIGANNWERLAPFTVRSLGILMVVLHPLVWLSQRITKTLKKDKDRSVLSRADFTAMAREGEQTGALDKSESTIIKNLLTFEKKTVRDIMTPKTVALMANEEDTLRAFYDQNQPLPFSRIPIYKENRDHVTGIILKDELLQHLVDKEDATQLKEIKRPIDFVQDDMQLPQLFQSLTNEKQHLFIVSDDFGVVVGIVTMEDLFETLLGKEIVDETDSVVDLQKLAKEQWEERVKKNKE
jgi:CBS domain containing-hemolysin-like protein